MNTKKSKNKNRSNKPPNPNPPQKIEIPPPTVEKVDEQRLEEITDCVLKCDERVPEIVSEVIKPLEVEVKESENDTPKKPKRNKGKKKQNDKFDEFNDSDEGKIQETAIEEPKTIENLESLLSEITPTARKKKNKKKGEKTIEPVPELEKQEIETKNISQEENKIIETQMMSSVIKEDVPQTKIETTEQEIKQPKKKNKKKKRHDSERSDKAEEALACTAAFQKLINVKDENVDEMIPDIKNVMVDSNKEKEEKIAATDILVPVKSVAEAAPVPEMPIEDQPLKSKEIMPKDEGKNKKRNKKEKKHPPKTESEKVEPAIIPGSASEASELPITSPIVETVSENPTTDQIIKIEEPVLESTVVEESLKPKAKIAKPVEKKRKGKHEKHDTIESDIATKETPLSTELIEEHVKSNIMQQQTGHEHIQKTPQTLLPEDAAEKKRKKKSKSPELKIVPDEKVSHGQKSTDKKPSETIKLIDVPPPETMGEVGTSVIISKEAATTIGSADIKDMSPGLSKQIDRNTETKDVTTKSKEGINPDKVKEEASAVKTDILFHLPPLSATELELSTSEIVPDIHYPRSISQQRLDSNNNMIIQEINVAGDIKLDSPISAPNSPLIQGSGESPLSTPAMVSSGISVIEVHDKPESKEEKTDLKSKMMEVNQDMILRLSIERSLAEFTALEKSENVVEKKIEEKERLQTKQDKDIEASKIETEYKNITSKVEEVKTELKSTAIVSADLALDKPELKETGKITVETTPLAEEQVTKPPTPVPTESPIPICPARREHKGKSKSKKKGKQEPSPASTTAQTSASTTETKDAQKETKKEEKTEQKSETTQEKGKQQSNIVQDKDNALSESADFEPIENFEDALTSSVDDVNKTFEIIVNEASQSEKKQSTPQRSLINPEINIIAPIEDADTSQKQKVHPVSQPKNLLGHTDIPVQSNRADYKKEKNKTPNSQQAKVKIKDSFEIENAKQSKESQTENKRKIKSLKESFSQMINDNEDYVYKYSFRKVFMQSACHVCKKELTQVRVPCNFCNLIFYCSNKHKDEDWTNHQALCFAVSTIVHLKDEKYIYGDAKNATGHDYRLIRMQMILSCEKVVKRRLVPWEQEALLYPRVCAAVGCREWRQAKLKDCEGCGQISFCLANPDHFPKSHQRWCKSYSLYQKLVTYQQTKGRLEPKMPSKVMADKYLIPEKLNEVLASLYEEKIDMNDLQYAALTQLATAPLTAAYCHQLYRTKASSPANGVCKKSSFTIHVVNAELQFEADALNKWEIFFLHLRPDIKDLNVVLIGADLNPSNLPLDLLAKVKLCDKCQNKRKVSFSFQDKITYFEYRCSDDYMNPDLVCAFNPSIHRSSVYNGKDPWPSTINSILKLKSPFIITAYTMTEMNRDLLRIKECTPLPYDVVTEPKYNNFASVRPDRNFISDDEIPLLFKNYCYSIVCGV